MRLKEFHDSNGISSYERKIYFLPVPDQFVFTILHDVVRGGMTHSSIRKVTLKIDISVGPTKTENTVIYMNNIRDH